MDNFQLFLSAIYGFIFILSVFIVIHLIYKRIKNKGKEGFEERDN
ncbi:MAG: hypothetical protein ACPGU5_08585 [Lishizhenia sp.]